MADDPFNGPGLRCHAANCEKRATHMRLLLNLEVYQLGCPDHPVKASNKVEAVVGLTTVLFHESYEETDGPERRT